MRWYGGVWGAKFPWVFIAAAAIVALVCAVAAAWLWERWTRTASHVALVVFCWVATLVLTGVYVHNYAAFLVGTESGSAPRSSLEGTGTVSIVLSAVPGLVLLWRRPPHRAALGGAVASWVGAVPLLLAHTAPTIATYAGEIVPVVAGAIAAVMRAGAEAIS